MCATKTSTMLPVSGRIPEDLYQWLSRTPMEGATTMSDRLRVAVATLKRLYDGDSDYAGALAMHRDLQSSTRRQISQLETKHGYSEVLATLLEHAPALSATLCSAQIDSLADAQRIEKQATQRCLQMTENLLRQSLTSQARAYDGSVVATNIQGLLELAHLLQSGRSQATSQQPD